MTITRFLGDGEHAFALPFDSCIELEKATGTTFGALLQRVRTFQFAMTDRTEIVRLALIAGGTSPKDAFDLTQTYVANRPIAETYPLVLEILSSAYLGEDFEAQGDEIAHG